MSIADLPLTYTKSELLDALEALRPKLKRADEKAIAEHKKAEDRHLAEFRRACRAALKWNYATVKKNGGYVATRRMHAPSCPTSRVSQLDSLIAMVERLNQERFTLSRHGRWDRIYSLLTADVPAIKGVC